MRLATTEKEQTGQGSKGIEPLLKISNEGKIRVTGGWQNGAAKPSTLPGCKPDHFSGYQN